MSKFFGTIESFGSESKTSKAGKSFTIHHLILKQNNGELVTIEMGFKPISGLSVGNFYEIDAEKKYGKWSYTAHTQSRPEAAPADDVRPSHYQKDAGFMVKTFPVPIDHPDRAIIRQNCIGNAVKMLTHMDQMGSTPDEAVDKIVSVAMKLEDFATGDLEYNALKNMTEEG